MHKEFVEYINEISQMSLTQKKETLDSLEKLIKLDPMNSKLHANLALFYLSVENTAAALKGIKSAILIDPGNEDLWFLQAYIYEVRKKYLFALDCYYKSYRLGSEQSKSKLLQFCKNMAKSELPEKQKKILEEFETTIC